MITSKDRSYYIGGSDTPFVIGNWSTKSFDKWYATKQGLYSMDFNNDAMRTGTAYEHKILEALKIPGMQMDRQVIKGRLRVNLDGSTHDTIYEVKTTIKKLVKVPWEHINQVNVEMYAFDYRKAFIAFYEVTEAEYKNYYLDIDPDRITLMQVVYDEEFINHIYLPRFNYLSDCLDRGAWPCMSWRE